MQLGVLPPCFLDRYHTASLPWLLFLVSKKKCVHDHTCGPAPWFAGISKHLVELGGHRRADDAGDCAECGQHAWSKAARKHGRYPEKTIPVKHVTHSGQDAQDTDAKHHGWHALTICCHRCCGGHHHCWHCGTCCDFKRGGSTKLCGWSRATDEGNAAEGNASGQGDASSDQLGGAGHDRECCCLVLMAAESLSFSCNRRAENCRTNTHLYPSTSSHM